MAEGGNAPPDLRIVASYDPQDFTALMRTGKTTSGREVGAMSEFAQRRYASFTDSEIDAVRDYLVELARHDP
jgi:hypothetical protein